MGTTKKVPQMLVNPPTSTEAMKAGAPAAKSSSAADVFPTACASCGRLGDFFMGEDTRVCWDHMGFGELAQGFDSLRIVSAR